MSAQFLVTIPAGITSGQLMQAQSPDGQMVQFQVPDGYEAGMDVPVAYNPIRASSAAVPLAAAVAPTGAPGQQVMFSGTSDPWELINGLQALRIKEKVQLAEILVGFEMPNKYMLQDPVSGKDLFIAAEKGEGVLGIVGRQLFDGDMRPFNMEIALLTEQGVPPQPFAEQEHEDEEASEEGSVASRTTGSRGLADGHAEPGAGGAEEEDSYEEEEEGGWEERSNEHVRASEETPVRRHGHLRKSLASVVSAWGSEGAEGEGEWISSEQAEVFFGSIIGLNALVLGLEVEAELRFGEGSMEVTLLYSSQLLFALLFLAEVALRVRALGLRWALCASAHRALDSALLLLTLLDLCVISPLVRPGVLGAAGRRPLDALGSLRILQLLRLVRIVRVLRVSRQLSLLVLGLAKSFLSVLWVFLMLFVLIYIGAVFCASELGATPDERLAGAFSTLWRGMYSHFKIMTLEAWPELCSWAMEQNGFWAFYFILYILLTNLALVNLLTGLIMDGVLQGAKSEDWSGELALLEAEPFLDTLRGLLHDQDLQPGQSMDQKRFVGLLADPLFQELLELYGISLRIEPEDLFMLLDARGSGVLSVSELAASLLRLRGSRDALHPLLVRDDLHRENRRLLSSLQESELRVSHCFDTEALRVERSLCARLQEVRNSLRQLPAVHCNLGPGCSAVEVALPPLEAETEMETEVTETELAFHAGAVKVPMSSQGSCMDNVWPELCPATRVVSVHSEEPSSGDAAWITALLRQASGRMQELRSSVQQAEAELRTSLAREAALSAALRSSVSECSLATQTQTHLHLAAAPALCAP